MIDFTSSIDEYIQKEKQALDQLDRNEINKFINLLIEARDSSKNIFIMGNGGSAATASHYCCDFNKGVSYKFNKRFKFMCLNDNIATLTAYANDVSYEMVFVEPLKNFLQPGDLVIGISGSGNSKNVLRAIDYANEHQAVTIGITGFSGGLLKQKARYSVNVGVNDMQISEDLHMMLDHLAMKIISGIMH